MDIALALIAILVIAVWDIAQTYENEKEQSKTEKMKKASSISALLKLEQTSLIKHVPSILKHEKIMLLVICNLFIFIKRRKKIVEAWK